MLFGYCTAVLIQGKQGHTFVADAVAAGQVGELKNSGGFHHVPAKLADEFDTGVHGAAGGHEVVHQR